MSHVAPMRAKALPAITVSGVDQSEYRRMTDVMAPARTIKRPMRTLPPKGHDRAAEQETDQEGGVGKRFLSSYSLPPRRDEALRIPHGLVQQRATPSALIRLPEVRVPAESAVAKRLCFG